jgi:hypothetical protein
MKVVSDKNFGTLNTQTQQWDGMIGELIRGVSCLHK